MQENIMKGVFSLSSLTWGMKKPGVTNELQNNWLCNLELKYYINYNLDTMVIAVIVGVIYMESSQGVLCMAVIAFIWYFLSTWYTLYIA